MPARAGRFGQPLENIGNKTSYEWIYNWVRDPKHYSPATYMPNLRLTDAQVADVATYLVGLKGPSGDQAKASPDARVTDEVLLDYMKNVMPFEDAKAQIAKMNPQQKQLELGSARPSAATAVSAATTSRASKSAEHRHRSVRRRQQAGHAPRLRVHHRHPAHVEGGVVRAQAARPAHLRQGTRAPAAREAADAELGLHRRRGEAAADRRS
jgi:hypothetical protein